MGWCVRCWRPSYVFDVEIGHEFASEFEGVVADARGEGRVDDEAECLGDVVVSASGVELFQLATLMTGEMDEDHFSFRVLYIIKGVLVAERWAQKNAPDFV